MSEFTAHALALTATTYVLLLRRGRKQIILSIDLFRENSQPKILRACIFLLFPFLAKSYVHKNLALLSLSTSSLSSLHTLS
jgi:hypothetical protein